MVVLVVLAGYVPDLPFLAVLVLMIHVILIVSTSCGVNEYNRF